MKFLKITLLLALATPFSSKADVSCVDIHSVNPENFVLEQHPVGYVNCYCTCSQWGWLDDSRCTMCNHKHGGNGNGTLLTAETDGTFMSFMSPAQALDYYRPEGSDWVESLALSATAQKSSAITPQSFSELKHTKTIE